MGSIPRRHLGGRSHDAVPGPGGRGYQDLHPSYFAFVLATGIISTGTLLLGPSWLSQALLVIASIGFVVLIAALVI